MGATSGAGTLEFTPVFSGVCVTRSLTLCVCFVDRCLSFCTFSFGHSVVCSSLIYGFLLPPFGILWPLCCLFFFDIRILITSLWYLQALLTYIKPLIRDQMKKKSYHYVITVPKFQSENKS
jgi:hypothetical protein